MPDTPARSLHHGEVASHIRGRLRVRLHRRSRHQHVMTRLQQAIAAQTGVQGVDVNHTAGSITVQYDAQAHGERGIFSLLEDLDVLIGTVMDAPHIETASSEDSGPSKAAG